MAPTVIFGMRPCDVSALEYLDDFYLGEYRDINYSMAARGRHHRGQELPYAREKLLLRGHGHRPLCPQRL